MLVNYDSLVNEISSFVVEVSLSRSLCLPILICFFKSHRPNLL
jgi:hypothetical protein